MRCKDKLSRLLAYDVDYFQTTSKPHNILPSSSSSILLSTFAIRISKKPSVSTHSPLPHSTDNLHSNFIGHHSSVWISLDTIIPTLGSNILAWIGRQLDHHVFGSIIIFRDIAQSASVHSTVHLLSIQKLFVYFQSIHPTAKYSVRNTPSLDHLNISYGPPVEGTEYLN